MGHCLQGDNMKIFHIGEEEIYSFEWDYINSNMYIICGNGLALAVDPVDTEEVRRFLLEKNPQKITVLLTHEHFDHISGVNWIRENFETEVCCSQACAKRICLASKNLSDKSDVIVMFNPGLQNNNLHIEPFECKADIVFEDRFLINWNGNNINIISTPGHSQGSVCIFFENKFVFTGDTLLEYPTITRLPGGDKSIFFKETLPFLKSRIDPNATIFPGHGKCLKIGDID